MIRVDGNQQVTVLVSEPNAVAHMRYLPYMWGVLKSYCERRTDLGASVRWLDPLYEKIPAVDLLRPSAYERIDVLGLSCYTWNWRLQCEIATLVKQRQPNCLVVAGGPDPDYKNPEFFRQHPYIDAIAVKDGEITFSRILQQVVEGKVDLTGIRGLYLPHPDDRRPIGTGVADAPKDFTHSPYLEQSSYYERLAAAAGPGALNATWETNRGCPYSCSYCDWGSSTMSKVRRFDLEIVKAEADWLARMKLGFVFLADANFGLLPRDLEIADLICDARQKHGFPRYLYYSAAKNNPERTIEIARKFARAGVAETHALAIQHTNRDVLEATARANISTEKQLEVVDELLKDGVAMDVQLICGIPGDTYASWKACLAELMEWGVHEFYYVNGYNLLPNAPAAEPTFRERWQVEVVDRYVSHDSTVMRPSRATDTLLRSRLLVACTTFSREDYIRMRTFAAFVLALHNASLTRIIALYLRFAHAVAYGEFYATVVEEYCSSAAAGHLYQRVVDHYRAYLEQPNAAPDMMIHELPDFGSSIDPGHWLVVQICRDFDPFFDGLAAFLRQRYPRAVNLDEAIRYQRAVIVLPSYDRRVGKEFPVAFNWDSYIKRATRLTRYEPIGEPEPLEATVVQIRQSTAGLRSIQLDWESLQGDARWIRWIQRVVAARCSALLTNFNDLRTTNQPLRPRSAALPVMQLNDSGIGNT